MPSNVIPLASRSQRNATSSAGLAVSTNQPEERVVYTVVEVAKLLSLSRGSAYALVRSGEIPAVRLGGRWVISRRRFHAWLDLQFDTPDDDTRREPSRLNRAV